MRKVKTQSGFVKVERTQAERIRDYSVSNEVMQDIQNRITSKTIGEAIVKAYKDARKDR